MNTVDVGIETPDLDASELYFNRELSWLQFNERVLELAEDPRTPLLERVKFLAIYASNADEFWMVRVAGLNDQVDAGIDARKADGLSPAETLEQVTERSRELNRRHVRQWEDVVRPELAEHGIRVVDPEDLDADELAEMDRMFEEQIFPVLTPLAVGPGRPFPYISNLSLSIAVWLKDPVGGGVMFARVKVPKEVLPRLLEVRPKVFVPLEQVIARNLEALFPGMKIMRHAFFRVSRDADFTVSDEADDLLRAVEDELRRRRFGEAVRLEVSHDMDPNMREYLVEQLAIEESQVVDVDGMLDLEDLWALHDVDGHRDLREAPWQPVTYPESSDPDDSTVDLMAAMRERDILVHHPYHSFTASVERFVQQAVADPDVLAVKMTVYRTSDDSGLVPSLIEAAERGKQAVCLVELKARFDERRNITWARSLEEAGAHVVHGLPGLKTHTKALFVVRREGRGVRHYVHIGTGNYHAKTARLYEDFGLFTTDEALAADVGELFNALTGAARSPDYRKAIVAPGPHAELVPGGGAQDDRGPARGSGGPDRAQDELARGPAEHPRPLRGVPGRGACGRERARHLLPAPRRAGRVGQHPRGVGGGPLSRALAHLRLRARRREPLLDRVGGPHAAQPGHPSGAAGAGGGGVAQGRAGGHPGALPRRRHLRLGAAGVGHVAAAQRRDPVRAARADGAHDG